MNLTILENRFLIDLAHEDLLKALKKTSNIFDKSKVLYNMNIDDSISYFYKEVDIYYSKLSNLWFSYIEHENRYLYAFGLNEPKKGNSNTPVCVFDFPKDRIEKNALGVFSRNSKGIVFILHRGTIQGITNEIQTKFKEKMVEADEGDGKTDFILIGNLNDPQIPNKLSEFVYGIDETIKSKSHDKEESKTVKTNNELNTKSIKESSLNLDSVLVHKELDESEEIPLVLKGLKEIKNHVTLNLFNKKALYNVIGPQLVDNYLQLLIKYELVTELKSGTYLFKPEGELRKFKAKYDKIINNKETPIKLDTKPKNTKICIICNHSLPFSKFFKSDDSEDGYSEKCKECSRKSYAVKALNELKKIVDVDSLFYKKDLLKLVENRTQYLDYIWTLQEFDLLEHDEKSDSYIFKPQKELDKFIEKYEDKLAKKEILETPTEKPIKKITKTCDICGKSLPISKFYKSSTSEDGFSNKCKECSEKATAANILSEIQKFVKIKDSFTKKKLLKNIENPAMIDYYIWTLQEQDLIKYQDKSDTYKINESKIMDYMPFLPENLRKGPVEIEAISDEPIDTINTENIDSPVENELKGACKKEIIYISEKNGNAVRNLILKGIIRKEEIFTTIKGLQSIILDQNKILISKFNENLSDIMMELEIKNESLDHVLKALENEKWKNRVILNNNSTEMAES